LYLDAPQQRFKALAIIDVSVVASFVRGEDKLVLIVVGLIFEPQVALMGIYIYIYTYINAYITFHFTTGGYICIGRSRPHF